MIAMMLMYSVPGGLAVELDRQEVSGAPAPGWYWGQAVMIGEVDSDEAHLIRIRSSRMNATDCLNVIGAVCGYAEFDNFGLGDSQLSYSYYDSGATNARVVEGSVSVSAFKEVLEAARDHATGEDSWAADDESVSPESLGQVVETWLPPWTFQEAGVREVRIFYRCVCFRQGADASRDLGVFEIAAAERVGISALLAENATPNPEGRIEVEIRHCNLHLKELLGDEGLKDLFSWIESQEKIFAERPPLVSSGDSSGGSPWRRW
ncbi:MAG: hypothetical protein ABH810_00800 [bacterium]